MTLYLHKNIISADKIMHFVINKAKCPLLDPMNIEIITSEGIEICEAETGENVIEEFTGITNTKIYYQINSEKYKSKNSNWVKRFAVA